MKGLYPGRVVVPKKIKKTPARTLCRYFTPCGNFVSARCINSEEICILKILNPQKKFPYVYIAPVPLEAKDLFHLKDGLFNQKDKICYEKNLNIAFEGEILTRFEKAKNYDYLIRVKNTIFLFRAGKEIDCLSGEEKIFPVCKYLMKIRQEGEIALIGIYKNIDKFPRRYRARIKINSFNLEKEVTIFLHGFVDPIKWHFVALTHFLKEKFSVDIRRIPPLCREMLEKKEESKKSLEKIPNCDRKRCLAENIFKEAHKILAPLCYVVQDRAVTFWEKVKTKKLVGINVGRGFSENVLMLQIITKEKIPKKKLNKILVTYGISYNWKDEHPEIHLNFVTMYESKRQGKKYYLDEKDFMGELELIAGE